MTTEHNPYLQFTREQWALLRDAVPLTLTEHDLQTLRGINEKVSLQEVEEIYLPLSRLLNLYVKAKQRRSRVLEQFLGQSRGKGTYIISIAGSVEQVVHVVEETQSSVRFTTSASALMRPVSRNRAR